MACILIVGFDLGYGQDMQKSKTVKAAWVRIIFFLQRDASYQQDTVSEFGEAAGPTGKHGAQSAIKLAAL